MSTELPIFTQKHLQHLIRQLKNQQTDVFSYAPGGDFSQEIMASIGPSPMFLIEEIVHKAIKEVIDEESRIDLEGQPDFFGYGEKLIKLPERQVVKVEFATLEHMRTQQKTLVDNHIKQIRAFLRHHDGLVVPIIRTMQELNPAHCGRSVAALARSRIIL